MQINLLQDIINNKRVCWKSFGNLFAKIYILLVNNTLKMGLKFAAKIVVNIFYDNKQKFASDEVQKHPVKCLKKQRSKENWFIEKLLVIFFFFFY